MSPGSWEWMSDVFQQAIRVPPEEREAFLERQCRNDDERIQVRELIANHEAANAKQWMQCECSPDTPTASRQSRLDPLAEDRHSARPPTVPDYELLKRIGRGGFGEVWLGRNVHDRAFCAVKMIPKSRDVELDGIRQYKRYVEDHRNLMPILHVGETSDAYCCIMPLADNAAGSSPVLDADAYEAVSLQRYLTRRGRLEPQEVIAIGIELLAGLQHLHEQGGVHGDVKPANVLQHHGIWRLGDHGLVSSSEVDTALGHTPGYVPPEGPGGRGADLYASGVVLFELLTGRGPHQLGAIHEGGTDDDLASPSVRPVRDVIRRAVDADMRRRHSSAREMAEDLERAWQSSLHRRRRWRFAVGGIAILAIIVLVGVFRPERDAGNGEQLPPPTPTEEPPAVRAKRFEVRHFRYDGVNDLFLGSLGREQTAAYFDDDVSVHITLTSAAYAFLLALDTDGEVRLLLPPSVDDPPTRSIMLAYPLTDNILYRLNGGPGVQGFMLIASVMPLPSWSQYATLHGTPMWANPGEPAEGVWIYDGTKLVPANTTRGEPLPRRGSPSPIFGAVEWARAQDVDAVQLIVFPVLPEQPR